MAQSVKRLLYSMRQRFGSPMDFYSEYDSETNIETGIITNRINKFHIEQGVFLNEDLISRGPLTKILGQLTGVIQMTNVAILIDGEDFPCDYEPKLNDYVIIKHQKYEIATIKQIDDYQSLFFELVEYKGAIRNEIHDIDFKDHLTIIEVVKSSRNHTYLIQLSDELSIDEGESTHNSGDPDKEYIGDYIDFTESIDTDFPLAIGTLYTRFLNDNIQLNEIFIYDAYHDNYLNESLIFSEQLTINKAFDPTIINVSDTLSLIELVESRYNDHLTPNVFNIYIDENVVLVDNLIKEPQNIHNLFISDHLSFFELPVHYEHFIPRHLSLSDVLLFNEVYSVTQPPHLSHIPINFVNINDAIVFSETLTVPTKISRSITDAISFTETFDGGLNTVIPSDVITFNEILTGFKPIFVSLTDKLNINEGLESIDISANTVLVTISDHIIFVEAPTVTNTFVLFWNIEINDTINFIESLINV